MEEPPAIHVAEIRTALDRVLSRVEQQLGPTIALTTDHYWRLPPNAVYDLASEPSGPLLVGNLADDVQEVRSMVRREPDEVVVWHDLAHLIGVLQRIASQDLATE